jgi:hypothetical protein
MDMDEVKKTWREGETSIAEKSREADGTDLGDHVGNIGDKARKDLGNLGDDIREGADRTYPDPQVSDKQY